MKKQSASLQPGKSSAARFDPFNNRLARDIRNTLAESYVDCLTFVANLKLLFDKLKTLDPVPPLLKPESCMKINEKFG